MEQRDLKIGIDGRDAPENEVTALLSSLPRVEAPGNFEFGVRARIAAGKSAEPRSSLVPLLKLAVPLSVLLLVTGLLLFFGAPVPDGVQTVAVTEDLPVDRSRTSSPEAGRQVDLPAGEQSAAKSSNEEIAVVTQQKERPVRRAISNQSNRPQARSVRTTPGGGSTVFLLESANTISPRGFNAMDRKPRINANASVVSGVPMRDVLGILGVDVDCVSGACRVSSVAENSLGSRAGMKTGDVIETMDGRAVDGETKVKDDGAKTFVVRRDGKRVNLKIGN